MSFSVTGLDINSGGAKGGVNIHTYKTSADTLATVAASGYFDDFGTAMQSNDLMYVQASDANGFFVLTNTSGVITMSVHNAGKTYLTARIADISTAETVWTPVPVAGKVTKIYSVIAGTIATADSVLTCKINAVAITTGAITVTASGSAAGDVDSVTPTAANVVAAGDALSVVTSAASTNAVQCEVLYEISPA